MANLPVDAIVMGILGTLTSILASYRLVSYDRHKDFYKKINELTETNDENGLLIYLLGYNTRDPFISLERRVRLKSIQKPDY